MTMSTPAPQQSARPGEPLAPLTFTYAPRLTHETVALLSPAQKERALHECIELLTAVKRHIYNPKVSPQTRVLALATILERAHYTAFGRERTLTDQAPIWIGEKEQEGSLVNRLGLCRNTISAELNAWEKAGLAKRFYRKSENGDLHLDISLSAELLTRPDLLPAKGQRPRRPPVACQNCGSLALIKQEKTRILCPDCGTVHQEHEHTSSLNQEQEEEETQAEKAIALQEEQPQQPLCTRDGQSNREKICTQDGQNDDPEEQGTPTGECPISPPQIGALTAVVQAAGSASLLASAQALSYHLDQFRETAWVRAWIGKRLGSGQLIRATGQVQTSSGKYVSLPEAARPDLEAYLAGRPDHLYGSRLQRADGKTWVLAWDFDDTQPAFDEQHESILRALAHAGAAPVYWQRRTGRGHLELYFDRPVDPQAGKRWAEAVVPTLQEVKECYPCCGKNALSWPLWQRIGDQITACEMVVGYPWQPEQLLSSPGIDLDRHGLILLLKAAITPASLLSSVPACLPPAAAAQATPPEEPRAPAGGGLLDPQREVLRAVLEEFQATHSWEEIAELCGGWDRGYFKAIWRGERTASVKPDRDGRYCCDYGNHGRFPKKLDKLGAWCLAQGLDQQQELARRCEQYRARLAARSGEPHGAVSWADPAVPPALVRGQRVQTPGGLATVNLVTYCEILKRWRCAVKTDQRQSDGSHWAVFDVSAIRQIV